MSPMQPSSWETAEAATSLAPSAPHALAPDGMWREADVLCVPRLFTLPPRCLKCNEPMDGDYLEQKVYWHPPGYYALLLLNALIYVVTALAVRKSATLRVGLCSRHRRIRRRDRAVAVGLLAGGPLVTMLGIATVSNPALTIAAWPLLWLAAALFAIARLNLVRPVRIDPNWVWLNGAGQPFLETARRR